MPISRDYLGREYVVFQRPIKELAEELGCHYSTVKKWLDHYGFAIRSREHQKEVNPTKRKKHRWSDKAVAAARQRWEAMPAELKSEIASRRYADFDIFQKKHAMMRTPYVRQAGAKLRRKLNGYLKERGDWMKPAWYCDIRLKGVKVCVIVKNPHFLDLEDNWRRLGRRLAGALDMGYRVILVKNAHHCTRARLDRWLPRVYDRATEEGLRPITVVEF